MWCAARGAGQRSSLQPTGFTAYWWISPGRCTPSLLHAVSAARQVIAVSLSVAAAAAAEEDATAAAAEVPGLQAMRQAELFVTVLEKPGRRRENNVRVRVQAHAFQRGGR